MSTSELSNAAKIADKVWMWMIYSSDGKFDDAKPSEIYSKHLIPIFGEKVIEELRKYYISKL